MSQQGVSNESQMHPKPEARGNVSSPVKEGSGPVATGVTGWGYYASVGMKHPAASAYRSRPDDNKISIQTNEDWNVLCRGTTRLLAGKHSKNE